MSVTLGIFILSGQILGFLELRSSSSLLSWLFIHSANVPWVTFVRRFCKRYVTFIPYRYILYASDSVLPLFCAHLQSYYRKHLFLFLSLFYIILFYWVFSCNGLESWLRNQTHGFLISFLNYVTFILPRNSLSLLNQNVKRPVSSSNVDT